MKKVLLFFSFLMAFGSNDVLAQQPSGPREKTVKEELKTNKQLRKEAREKRRQERAEQKAIRAHHKRIQSKRSIRSMKENRRKSSLANDRKRENVFRRWFKKRKH